MSNSYKGFKDLNCWQEARLLRKELSEMAKKFPRSEQSRLNSQIVRASRSVTANIAEGYGRYTYTDTRHFFIQARGSVTELMDHLSVAFDEGYIEETVLSHFEQKCEAVFRLINGYISYLDRSKKGSKHPNSHYQLQIPKMRSLLKYTLQLADNALILGHRISEWCGHGPILEQDIAITNTALDHLGQARSFYQYAAEQFNTLPASDKATFFASTGIQKIIAEGKQIDEDDLAYLRDGWDYRNVLLVEQPNKDWAYTIIRSFFYDVFNFFFYTELQKHSDTTLSAIAEKSLKEVTYHLRWSSEWVIRLGDGTEESAQRIKAAIADRWQYSGELFIASEADKAIGIDLAAIKASWKERVASVFAEANIDVPADGWMHSGGKDGKHSEHLGYILAELQFVQRAYPNMQW